MGVINTSRNGNLRASLRAALLAGSALLAITVAIPAVEADSTTTTTPQYTQWSGTKDQQMKTLIADLKAKIAAGEQSQAASPDFLADLKALSAKFEALQTSMSTPSSTSTAPASGTQVFSDDFSDGNYTTSPTWKVSAGTWSVDPSGSNHGLTSKIKSQKVNLTNVLGALLNQQNTSQTQTQSQFASIYTAAKIPNAFTLKATLTSRDRQGGLNLGVYQGSAGTTLYRMVYQPGGTPGIAIQKVTSSGATTLGSSSSSYNLEDGQPHDLVLTRDASGNMTVTVDGSTAATAKDTSLTGDMTGLLFVNSGGTYYFRSVTVTAS
jgi:hypothetical protein